MPTKPQDNNNDEVRSASSHHTRLSRDRSLLTLGDDEEQVVRHHTPDIDFHHVKNEVKKVPASTPKDDEGEGRGHEEVQSRDYDNIRGGRQIDQRPI